MSPGLATRRIHQLVPGSLEFELLHLPQSFAKLEENNRQRYHEDAQKS